MAFKKQFQKEDFLKTLSHEEIQALVDLTRDIDLNITEDDEYTELIRSAHMKLTRMME